MAGRLLVASRPSALQRPVGGWPGRHKQAPGHDGAWRVEVKAGWYKFPPAAGRPALDKTCCHCEERQRRGNPPMVRTVMGIVTALKRLAMTTEAAQHRWDT